jgi:hypothetical protein
MEMFFLLTICIISSVALILTIIAAAVPVRVINTVSTWIRPIFIVVIVIDAISSWVRIKRRVVVVVIIDAITRLVRWSVWSDAWVVGAGRLDLDILCQWATYRGLGSRGEGLLCRYSRPETVVYNGFGAQMSLLYAKRKVRTARNDGNGRLWLQ